MAFGSAPASAGTSGRILEPAEWADAGIPLLRSPRDVVTGLHTRHQPTLATAVVAVLDPEERLLASASFGPSGSGRRFSWGGGLADGWHNRNALLAHLRRVIPHDLRRRTPVRTAVLLYCRGGGTGWTEEDGAWMWGLRDACTLHGLRCGAYITLTPEGWHVLGEGRGGRSPNAPAADKAYAEEADAPVGLLRKAGGATPSTPLRRAAAR